MRKTKKYGIINITIKGGIDKNRTLKRRAITMANRRFEVSKLVIQFSFISAVSEKTNLVDGEITNGLKKLGIITQYKISGYEYGHDTIITVNFLRNVSYNTVNKLLKKMCIWNQIRCFNYDIYERKQWVYAD